MTTENAEYCKKESLREREREKILKWENHDQWNCRILYKRMSQRERERTKRNVSEIELRNVTGKEG